MIYKTAVANYRAAAGDFSTWALSGVSLNASSALQLDFSTALPGRDARDGYNGGNFYNGGDYWVGEATSPILTTEFPFEQAIPSWNAAAPSGTWIEVLLRAAGAQGWTEWLNLGVWALDTGSVQRHSVSGQNHSGAAVYTDTFALSGAASPGEAIQARLRLFCADGACTPSVDRFAVAYSTRSLKQTGSASAGDPSLWNRVLSVPMCSQMAYPDGGHVWCSPTCIAMLLSYWRGDVGPCEPVIRRAVDGVYDWIYQGHGNWSFNAAYAGAQSALGLPLEALIARLPDLTEVEKWISAGTPVIASLSWEAGELTGAPIPSSKGHLVVITGFDISGNPIVNDPAAPVDAEVQRTYLRGEFENLWLGSSGGVVYLIYPQGWRTP